MIWNWGPFQPLLKSEPVAQRADPLQEFAPLRPCKRLARAEPDEVDIAGAVRQAFPPVRLVFPTKPLLVRDHRVGHRIVRAGLPTPNGAMAAQSPLNLQICPSSTTTSGVPAIRRMAGVAALRCSMRLTSRLRSRRDVFGRHCQGMTGAMSSMARPSASCSGRVLSSASLLAITVAQRRCIALAAIPRMK